MLSKLFRPRWQHENPQTRKAAIEKFSLADQGILEQLALNDNDSSVRHQAVEKIEDLSLLENIINKSTYTGDREFAAKCWALKLINNQQLSPADIEQYIISCNNEFLLAGIIENSKNSNLQELALSGITSETQLLSLMENSRNARVWQMIITKLKSEETLKKAQLIVNGRDKKSQQMLKGQLDEIKSAAAKNKSLEEQTQHLLKKLEQLLKTSENPQFEGILLIAKRQWAELSAQIESGYAKKITQAIKQCENLLEESARKKVAAAQIVEKTIHNSETLDDIQIKIVRLKEEMLNGTIFDEDSVNQLEKLDAEWEKLGNTAKSGTRKVFDKNRKTIHQIIQIGKLTQENSLLSSLCSDSIKNQSYKELEDNLTGLRQILSDIHWPADERKPAALSGIENLLQHALEQRSKLQDQIKTCCADVKRLMGEFEHTIAKKDLDEARKQQKKIRAAISRLPEANSRKFAADFQRISHALSELEDWKDFATDPKRESLCHEMQKLVHTDIPPLHKAENIKQLQDEWKSLGHCHDQSLWRQFKQYADEAYIPCQQYFDEQKQIRQFNSRQKTIICEQIEKFISGHTWENCDWKSVEKLCKTIQEEWQKFSPVERHEHNPLQDRFFPSLNLIKQKLDEERKRNINKLMNLVRKAGQLQNSGDIRDAIEQYNNILEEWKSVGITHRKEQQEQWKMLKSIGDSLYTKRHELREEADIERQQKLTRADDIHKKILQLSELNNSELAASRSGFECLCEEFRMLDLLPRNTVAGFQAACDAYESAVRNIKKRTWVNQLESLALLAKEWEQAELAGQAILFDSFPDTIPEAWKNILQKRFSAPLSAELEKSARLLCIELEILCETPTPKEDSSLKMELQMAKLAEHFSSPSSASFEEKLEDIYLRWFSIPCWNRENHEALGGRFLSTAKSAINRKSNG